MNSGILSFFRESGDDIVRDDVARREVAAKTILRKTAPAEILIAKSAYADFRTKSYNILSKMTSNHF